MIEKNIGLEFIENIEKCKDEVNILHISDLHFGLGDTTNIQENKFNITQHMQTAILTGLIDTLTNDNAVPHQWKPNVVVISGDIAWKGQKEEYLKYIDSFLKPLIYALNITQDEVICCPGNHDVIREEAELIQRPEKNSDISKNIKELTRDSIGKRSKYFAGYVEVVCDGDYNKLCHLVTLDKYPFVSFAVLNSSWDCRDNFDVGTLRVGNSLLTEILSDASKDNIIVSIFHHPYLSFKYESPKILEDGTPVREDYWLHWTERQGTTEGNPYFVNTLERNSDFILNAHIHKKEPPKKTGEGGGICLVSGALYSTDTVEYHCRIIKISKSKEPLYMECTTNLSKGDDLWETTTPKDFKWFEPYWVKKEKAEIEKEKMQRLQKDLEEKKYTYSEMVEIIKETMKGLINEMEIENLIKSFDIHTNKTNHTFNENHLELRKEKN